jgi:hypothetical protein
MATELEVVMGQLDELLSSGIDDEDDALEIACLAGTAYRLGADPAWLEDARVWRDGPGADLLESAFQLIDLEPLVERVDAVSCGDAETDEEIEEAVFDFDDIVVAAIWCKAEAAVRDACQRVEQIIRMVPDLFADMAPYGKDLARRRAVVEAVDLYGYWFAIADAAVEEA